MLGVFLCFLICFLHTHFPCNNNCANKQIVLDLWKLTDESTPRYDQQTSCSMSAARQVYLREHIVGSTYLDRVEREGKNLPYRRDSRKGREISGVVSMVEEMFVQCGGGSTFQTQVQPEKGLGHCKPTHKGALYAGLP